MATYLADLYGGDYANLRAYYENHDLVTMQDRWDHYKGLGAVGHTFVDIEYNAWKTGLAVVGG